MKLKSIFMVLVAFILGILSTIAILNTAPDNKPAQLTTSYVIANAETVKETQNSHFITRVLGLENVERPSPYDWVPENKISVEKERIVVNIEGAQWSKFTDTNSMDPVIDEGANAIQIVPKDLGQIHVGDIVSYESDYADGTIIHRVVEIGYDDIGWYCLMKGDNNSNNDPGKIRFSQIRRVVVAIIY
ncbi:MAG: S26 family signal peptidase [archaeon]